MKKLTAIGTLLVAWFGGMALAEEPPKAQSEEPPKKQIVWNAPENISGSVWLTTDYVFRGISNTDENPAVQGSLDYTFKGFYIGIWGSNTSFTDAAIEIDYYGGYAGAFGNLGYDVMVIYYTYPDGGDDPEPNYFEAHLGLTYTFAGIPLTPTIGAGYDYSPDFFGEDGDAHHVNGILELSLPYLFTLSGEVGYQEVEGDESTGDGQGMDGGDGFDYVYWKIGLAKEIPKWFTLDLSYYKTDNDAENFFGDIADSRFVFTVTRTF